MRDLQQTTVGRNRPGDALSRRVLRLGAAISVFFALGAAAGTVYTETFSGSWSTGTPGTGTPPVWSITLPVTLFRATGSTSEGDLDPLLRMDVIISATVSGDFTIANPAANGNTTYTYVFGTDVTVSDGAGISLSAAPEHSGAALIGPGSFFGDSVSGSDTDAQTTSLVTDLGHFTYDSVDTTRDLVLSLPDSEGITGNWDEGYLSLTTISGKDLPTLQSLNETVSYTVTVRYHTPEPATLSLLGLLLVGSLARRRRRSV